MSSAARGPSPCGRNSGRACWPDHLVRQSLLQSALASGHRPHPLSVASARSDGGVNRTTAGATAFANLKSIVRTCQKQGRNFLSYGLSLVGFDPQNQPLPYLFVPSLPTSAEPLPVNTS